MVGEKILVTCLIIRVFGVLFLNYSEGLREWGGVQTEGLGRWFATVPRFEEQFGDAESGDNGRIW
jgi:hypothetical protein